MKKKIILGCLSGASLGLTISIIITIIISACINDGSYHPTKPEFVAECGNELNAFVSMCLLAWLYGAGWGGAQAIYTYRGWSLLKRTVIHFVITSCVTLPIAYFAFWMDHNTVSVLLYFIFYFSIYVVWWMIWRAIMKKKIGIINNKLHENGSHE